MSKTRLRILRDGARILTIRRPPPNMRRAIFLVRLRAFDMRRRMSETQKGISEVPPLLHRK